MKFNIHMLELDLTNDQEINLQNKDEIMIDTLFTEIMKTFRIDVNILFLLVPKIFGKIKRK